MSFKPQPDIETWNKSAEKALPSQLIELNTHLKSCELRLAKVVESLAKVADPELEHNLHQLRFLHKGMERLKDFLPSLRAYVEEQSKGANPRRKKAAQ